MDKFITLLGGKLGSVSGNTSENSSNIKDQSKKGLSPSLIASMASFGIPF
jgi:hypothetical protein